MAASVGACLLTEFCYERAAGLPDTLRDRSAAVTGLLLALSIPPRVPLWLAAAGGIFAILAGKMLCGGLGENPFNPALAARAFLMLFWPGAMTRFADGVTSATPLHHMRMPALPGLTLWEAFLWKPEGCIGEVSAMAVLLGGGWLLARGVIHFAVPASYLGTAAVLSLLVSHGQPPLLWMGYSLLCGGMLLGAFFMATDYASSPVTPRGQILYGVGCGALTVLFRSVGIYPEGVTYAILLMNAAAGAVDRITLPRRFGRQEGET